jgi:hypothetical protein
LAVKSQKELLATIKPQHWKYLREGNGSLPDGWDAPMAATSLLCIYQSGAGCE